MTNNDAISLAESIRMDYERRYNQKRALEAQWKLNANFVAGKQYCRATASGSIIEQDKRRFWEERAVYNHTASILETRLAKLAKVRPKITVLPVSPEESAVKDAKVSSAVIDSACSRLNLGDLISEATMWSELTGTAFYKISWDKNRGMVVGVKDDKEIREGDVRVDVCPPYEIFPDSIHHRSVERCNSIIHAKAVSIAEIYANWGVNVAGETDTLNDYSALTGILMTESPSLEKDYALVLERFTRPNARYPLGRYEVVAGGQVLYEGDLPYVNGDNGERDLPFVRQCSTLSPSGFFGTSPIERAIPVQRAYNAVKNRKHEFMNRIASGVLVVEDGSVDVDELEEDGLEPGKIIVYRQGSNLPSFLDAGEIPNDFSQEEDKLMEEMARVSGVSEFMRSTSVPSAVSGHALQLLIEQDDSRLAVTADQITSAVKAVGKHMLKLYRQFAGEKRLSKVVGDEGEMELLYWKASRMEGEVAVSATPEIGDSFANRRSLILELYKSGLFDDQSGKTAEHTRRKILQALGYSGLNSDHNLERLHEARAGKENLGKIGLSVKSYDDHAVHIAEHTAFLLSGEADGEQEKLLEEHIAMHKAAFLQKEEE